jgi:hypothetical protein
VDEELKELLGTVRKKTWALVIMLFAAALFIQFHVKHDLEQEREIWRLLEYVSHLEKQVTIYYNKVEQLKRAKHICIPPQKSYLKNGVNF